MSPTTRGNTRTKRTESPLASVNQNRSKATAGGWTLEAVVAEIRGVEERITTAKFNSKFAELDERVRVIEDQVPAVNYVLSELNSMRLAVSKLSTDTHQQLSADAVLFGLPQAQSEDLNKAFKNICSDISFDPPELREIFKTKKESANAVVVAKFHSPQDRNKVLKAFGKYRKAKNSAVCLKDLGFESEEFLYIYESLTTENMLESFYSTP